MSRLVFRDLGAANGVCACCFVDTELRMRESRFVRTWRDRFDRTFVPQVQRTATCPACHSTYPIRATDRTPAAAIQRTMAAAPHRSTDDPGYNPGRDWRDTTVNNLPVRV
jgi:hypothetical protein